jgi:4-hydroxy-tetrahydrodipicolinate synthase
MVIVGNKPVTLDDSVIENQTDSGILLIYQNGGSMHEWSGVFPAVTTKFRSDFSLDLPAMEKHFNWMVESGVDGIVILGSLGENMTLLDKEKQAVIDIAMSVAKAKIPVIACVAETSTAKACTFVQTAQKNGVDGFMVLPAIPYPSDRRETIAHYRAIAEASEKPIMIYNNPVAYRVDITPDMFAEMADEPKFVAIKESSDNIRRITDIINLVGNRYALFCGVDDLALEAMMLGASGWLAGLVCAFPKETVALYRLVKAGKLNDAVELYRWFMPLLHLDVSTKFVQNIKLTEALVGVGTETVRPPRLPLVGDERAAVEKIVAHALQHRPEIRI